MKRYRLPISLSFNLATPWRRLRQVEWDSPEPVRRVQARCGPKEWTECRFTTRCGDFFCPARMLATMRCRSNPCCAANRSFVERTSEMTVSAGLSICCGVFIANEFLWCTDDWNIDRVSRKASSNAVLNVGIGDMLAVPCQEIIHFLNC